MKALRKALQFIADIILLPFVLILCVIATLVYIFSPDDERTRNWVKGMMLPNKDDERIREQYGRNKRRR